MPAQKLKDDIQLYTRLLASAKPSELPEVHYTLAKLYNFVDSEKVVEHVASILNLTESDQNNEIRQLARLSLSRALTSKRKIEAARTEVEEVLAFALLTDNKKLLSTAKIYRLHLCPFGNESKLGNELIEELTADDLIRSDAQLTCTFHQATADFMREMDSQSAIQHLYLALESIKKLHQPWLEGMLLCKLGIFAELSGDALGAEKHYLAALPLLITHECTQYVFQTQVAFSKLRITQKRYEEAIAYAEQAYQTASSIHFKSGMEFALNHKITALLWLHRLEEAELLANEIINHTDSDSTKGITYNILSNIAVQKGELEKGISYAKLGYEIRKDTLRPQDEMSLHEKLYKLNKRIGKLDEALHYLELVLEQKTKLMDETRATAVAEMQAKYEAEKREAALREARLQQTESELKAIKAQMNPHFIFNALNSIQEIFFLGDKRLANKHLSRFSQLMRSILKASGKKAITLQEEIEMLTEYLTLEALRFGQSFSFSITLTDEIDPYTLDVPPMIIQPFVENSVKHGLLHKEGDQQLSIHIQLKNDDLLQVIIQDNGVGRAASANINKHRSHQSFATSATQKRFDMLNLDRERQFGFTYTDLQLETGEASGTLVVIDIPI